jgi:hypothetical protein
MTERRQPLSETETSNLAEIIVSKMTCKHGCPLSAEDITEVKNLISIRKKSVTVILYTVGVIILWILKDLYFFIATHLNWGKP